MSHLWEQKKEEKKREGKRNRKGEEGRKEIRKEGGIIKDQRKDKKEF